MRPAPSTRPGAADPRALRGPARVITALLLSLLLLLTACGDQGGAAGSSASGGGGADSEQYAASLEKAATALKQNAVDDPKSITGPTEAASVPDVEPIPIPASRSCP